MNKAAFLAVDWGTTNRRVFALSAAGEVLATERDGTGLLSVPPGGFVAEAEAIRQRFGDLPMICAGMVGSARGWVNAPYAACPAGLSDLAERLVWAEPGRTAIVPGLSCINDDGTHGDVMRGEDVQLLGAVTAGMASDNGLLCQPGTHCKWARMAGGAVADFTTAMTGEVFALLKAHSLLADFLTGEVQDSDAFREGARDGLHGGLLNRLFGIRAASLLGLRSDGGRDGGRDSDSTAYASGLLIGSDVRAQWLGQGELVHVLADAQLGGLYAAVIEEAGGRAILVDSHAAFVAGITHIWSLTHDIFRN